MQNKNAKWLGCKLHCTAASYGSAPLPVRRLVPACFRTACCCCVGQQWLAAAAARWRGGVVAMFGSNLCRRQPANFFVNRGARGQFFSEDLVHGSEKSTVGARDRGLRIWRRGAGWITSQGSGGTSQGTSSQRSAAGWMIGGGAETPPQQTERTGGAAPRRSICTE